MPRYSEEHWDYGRLTTQAATCREWYRRMLVPARGVSTNRHSTKNEVHRIVRHWSSYSQPRFLCAILHPVYSVSSLRHLIQETTALTSWVVGDILVHFLSALMFSYNPQIAAFKEFSLAVKSCKFSMYEELPRYLKKSVETLVVGDSVGKSCAIFCVAVSCGAEVLEHMS